MLGLAPSRVAKLLLPNHSASMCLVRDGSARQRYYNIIYARVSVVASGLQA